MQKTNKTEHNKKEMLAALEKSLGVVTTACNNAKVSRTQFYQWVKDDKDFAAQVLDIENITLDFVESSLHKSISKGSVPAIIFHLKTKGKKRGYVERVEQDINLTTNIPIIQWIGGDKSE